MIEYGVEKWTTIQRQRTWQWARKMAQDTSPRWNHSVNTWQLLEARGRGRPKTRWADTINDFLTDMLHTTHTNNDWHKVAEHIKRSSSLEKEFAIATDVTIAED